MIFCCSDEICRLKQERCARRRVMRHDAIGQRYACAAMFGQNGVVQVSHLKLEIGDRKKDDLRLSK